MMAMVQRLDAGGFFVPMQLSVSIFFALVLKVFRNRFGCHGQSVTELSPFKLVNFGHSVISQTSTTSSTIVASPVRLGLAPAGTFSGRGRK